ncbi:unnamed protein product [Oppiella nova]|uniref:Uncharacterized protein n=1 Tax=Oppiella nova TaxID=334625 RepID=A0A7R9QXF8_9ACAR|nr:unnamed protein product [Oppiella nova]CAG2177983.1 unnamed protein product [Oppiella nova]
MRATHRCTLCGPPVGATNTPQTQSKRSKWLPLANALCVWHIHGYRIDITTQLSIDLSHCLTGHPAHTHTRTVIQVFIAWRPPLPLAFIDEPLNPALNLKGGGVVRGLPGCLGGSTHGVCVVNDQTENT